MNVLEKNLETHMDGPIPAIALQMVMLVDGTTKVPPEGHA